MPVAKPAGLCGYRFLEEFTCQRPAGHKGRTHKCTTSTGMRVSFTPFTERQKATRARLKAKKEKMELLRARVTEQGWIPVSERLPEPQEWCLITEDGDVQMAQWGGGDVWWSDDSALAYPYHEVTHWMPLPAPPGAPEQRQP